MNNQHPELFRRNKLNPILSADDWPYPVNSVFNAGATLLGRRHDAAVVPRRGSPRPFAFYRGPLRQRCRQLAHRIPADAAGQPGKFPRRTLGN